MKIVPDFLRVDKLVRRLLTPKNTFQSVTRKLVTGLKDGSIVLDRNIQKKT